MVSKMIDFSLPHKTWTPVVWLQEKLCGKIALILLQWRSSLFLGLLTSIQVYVWRRAFIRQESSPYIWWKFCTHYWTPISFNIKRIPTCYWISSISFCAWSCENMWMVREAASSQEKKAGLRWATRLHLWQQGRREAWQLLYSTQMNDGWTELSGLLICSLIISEIDQGKAIPFLSDKKYLLTSLY